MLSVAGIGFGVLTSAVDHGFGPYSQYTSKILGNDWSWLISCFFATFPAKTWRMATRRGITFTWCAVAGYYVADSLAGTYATLGGGFDAAGVIMDALFYTIAATILSVGVGAVTTMIHGARGRWLGFFARCAIPGYVAYDALSARAALRRSAAIVDPAMLNVSLYIGYAALVVLAGVVVLGGIGLRNQHHRVSRDGERVGVQPGV